MRTTKAIAVVLLSVLLASCAVTENATIAHSQSPDAVSVAGRWHKEGLLKWEGHRLDSVDGKSVSFGLVSNPYAAAVKVDPGHRKLVVLALFNVDRTQYSATIPMEVDLLSLV